MDFVVFTVLADRVSQIGRSAARAVLAALLFIATLPQCSYALTALSFRLSWEAPIQRTDGSALLASQIMGYAIYRGASPSGSAPTAIPFYTFVPSTLTSFTDSGLLVGAQYVYEVKSIDSSGRFSDPLRLTVFGLSGIADEDGDAAQNGYDNCAWTSNATQSDTDGDGFGDACDHALTETCAVDQDADGICELVDNCPDIANSDQTDDNANGIGNACELSVQRISCQRDSATPLSSLGVERNGTISLITPLSGESASTALPLTGASFLGNLRHGPGHEGFGVLEVGQAVSDPTGLSVAISSTRRLDSISFGQTGDSIIGCYLDDDNQLDLVALNTSSARTRLSHEQIETDTALPITTHRILHAVCANVDDDSRDELIILYKASRQSVSVGVIDPLTGVLATTYSVSSKAIRLAIADTSGAQQPKICTLSKLNKRESAIACGTNGRRSITVPAARDLVAGRFDLNAPGDTFVVLHNNGKLSSVNAKGRIRPLTSPGAGIGRTGGGRSLRIVPCN